MKSAKSAPALPSVRRDDQGCFVEFGVTIVLKYV